MAKPITLKTKSLYIGHYDFEGESASNYLTFAFNSNASDEEIEKHFRETVYAGEYGESLTVEDCERVEIYEVREVSEYGGSKLKNYKISLS